MNQNDEQLVARVQRGEASAFDELVRRYDRRVLSIATSYTRDPDDAQDVYQEAFLRAYRALPRFEFRSEFSTWLYRIVTNVCLTHRTRAARRPFVSLASESGSLAHAAEASATGRTRPVSPEAYTYNAEIARHVRTAMDALSPRQKLAFTLKHYQGYKIREIAVMMNCGEGTIKKYLFTATDRLRKRLKNVL